MALLDEEPPRRDQVVSVRMRANHAAQFKNSLAEALPSRVNTESRGLMGDAVPRVASNRQNDLVPARLGPDGLEVSECRTKHFVAWNARDEILRLGDGIGLNPGDDVSMQSKSRHYF